MSDPPPPLAITGADEVLEALARPERMAALARSRLLDSPAQEAFDRVTRLASRHLGAPVVLVNIVDDHRQFFKSAVGVPAGIRELPLTHSVCKYVGANDQPLVISDAAKEPLVADNALVRDLGIQTYCGVPLHDEHGNVLGAFCAMDFSPREWGPDDVAALEDLAEIVRSEINLRSVIAAQHDAERARGDVIGVLAHDLRAPLAVVATGASTLRRHADRLTESTRDGLFDSLERSAVQAGELVDRLLLADGRASEFELQLVDLRRELENLVQDRQVIAPDSTFTVEGPDELAVEVDASMFRQAAANLIDNAIAHAGPAISVKVRLELVDGDVHLEVADDGVGLDEQAQATVFERFSRGQGSRGHGLGLHIVRRIAEDLGGDVGLKSSAGAGASFHLRFPVLRDEAGPDDDSNAEADDQRGRTPV